MHQFLILHSLSMDQTLGQWCSNFLDHGPHIGVARGASTSHFINF